MSCSEQPDDYRRMEQETVTDRSKQTGACMTEEVLISITGLHKVAGDSAEDVEMIYPGICRRVRNVYYVKYDEVMEGLNGRTRNLIRLQDGRVELHRLGFINTNMVFQKGKKTFTMYETPFGSVEMGIAATKVDVTMEPGCIDAMIVYALDIRGVHQSDCSMEIRVTDKNSQILMTGNRASV